MEIQISVFLVIYLIYLAVFLFFTFFNLQHMLRFGFSGFGIYLITFLYVGITIAALLVSFIIIAQVDWGQSITIFSVNSFSGPYLN